MKEQIFHPESTFCNSISYPRVNSAACGRLLVYLTVTGTLAWPPSTRGVATFVKVVRRTINQAALRPFSRAVSEADRSASILPHANFRAATKSDLLITALKFSTARVIASVGAGCAEQQVISRPVVNIAASSASRRTFTDGVWLRVMALPPSFAAGRSLVHEMTHRIDVDTSPEKPMDYSR